MLFLVHVKFKTDVSSGETGSFQLLASKFFILPCRKVEERGNGTDSCVWKVSSGPGLRSDAHQHLLLLQWL